MFVVTLEKLLAKSIENQIAAIFVVVETGHLYQQNAVEQDLMSENIELVSAF